MIFPGESTGGISIFAGEFIFKSAYDPRGPDAEASFKAAFAIRRIDEQRWECRPVVANNSFAVFKS